MKPRLLELFCKAGGATKGYQMAGFYVVGVDKDPQPRYCGDEFYQADAFEYIEAHHKDFDVFHASPPCQRYSRCTPVDKRDNHPDHLMYIRMDMIDTGKPWVLENVVGAAHMMFRPFMLCGTHFGLKIFRHRLFEVNPRFPVMLPQCKHDFVPVCITGTSGRKTGRVENTVSECREASGIDWMTRKELDEAIPPAYTHWIGLQLMRVLK